MNKTDVVAEPIVLEAMGTEPTKPINVTKVFKGNKGQLPDVITADFTKRSQYGWVPVDALNMDAYQRPEEKSQISKIAHNWNPDMGGIIVVNQRVADGPYYVIDGRQRLAGMMRIENHPSHVYCEIFRGLTLEQEAALFRGFATQRRNLTAAALFRAMLVEGNQTALDIVAAAEANGFTADPNQINNPNPKLGQTSHNFRAFKTLQDIHRRNGKPMLDRIFKILGSSWPNKKENTSEPLLRGLEEFLRRYPTIDDARFISILQATTPTYIIGTARRLQEDLYSSQIYPAVGQVFLGLYNKRLHKKLPSW